MKMIKTIGAGLVAAAVVCMPLGVRAGEDKADTKAKPYPLTTCVVSNEKIGEMGKQYVFTHEGREIKICCKDCLQDLKKYPSKYSTILDQSQANVYNPPQ